MKLLSLYRKKKFLYFLFSLIIFIFDQILKKIVESNILLLMSGVELGSFLNLVFVTNRGVSFGFLASLDISFYLGIFSMLVSIFIIIWILRSKKHIEMLSLSMILGGALGNGYDRVLNSYVIDFIDIHIGRYHWPAFNLADAAITIGAIIYILDNLIDHKKLKN